MKRIIQNSGLMLLWVFVSLSTADTFRHRESGETFTGFVTQKAAAGKTLVYNSDEGKMTPIVLDDYEVAFNAQGRRNTISLLQITQPEILLSEVISKKAAAAIVEASNKGPQAIIIQIDSPGGRGDYMKHIALAVSGTTNCPVIAYISGGDFGGAYSSAALIALACDKIYIHPATGIGAVGPAVGSLSAQTYGNYLATYSSNLLVTYISFADSLAQQHNRPVLLAKAMVDKTLSVVEVANKEGGREFIRKEDRQGTQTIISTLSEGMSQSSVANLSEVSPADVVGKVLALTAQQAVDFGFADGFADSVRDIMTEMQMAETQITPVQGIESQIKKYTAARRNIAQGLSRIEQYEDQVETLSEQFSQIDNQLRTAMQTREVTQGNLGTFHRSTRHRYRRPDSLNYYYGQTNNVATTRTDTPRRIGNQTAQRITTTEPAVNIQIVYQQLASAYQQLTGEYRRTLNLVKRWPGGLPPELSAETLRGYMDSAAAELEQLYRYQPPYLLQGQQVPSGFQRR